MTKGRKKFQPLTSENICSIYRILYKHGLVSFSLEGCSLGSLDAIVANINNSYFGVEIYRSAEEKAVAYLYFLIKDHPFNDGNKRIGSFLFLLYLKMAGMDLNKMNENTITALALLVAESAAEQKELMIKLIMHILI